jgi:hypothetical protein
MLALAITAAIVITDGSSLRAAPRDTAPRQTTLWQGDWLEVRGEKQGFLQVYDHRRERPGYVRAWQVRSYPLDETSAPKLKAVIEFVRDTPGAEALGIGYAALYLRAAPPSEVGSDLFDALGTLAERLGRRASARWGKPGDAALAAHLDVAASYGVKLVNLDGAQVRICYDGEAFRRVLALPGATPLERARAALALTPPECVDPALGPVERLALDRWRAEVLERAAPEGVPPFVANRLRMRRAAVQAALAYAHARGRDDERARQASEAAVRELALVDKAELAEDDGPLYDETAIRVGAARWASEPPRPQPAAPLALAIAPGKPGETCLRLMEPKRAAPLVERCTYGIVWAASVRAAPRGNGLAVAVQPLAGWLELWVLQRGEGGWRVDTLAPATTDPELGYVELAGWSPDGAHLLVVREARVAATATAPAALHRDFQLLATATLAVEKQARDPELLVSFRRWHSADWRSRTIAIR